MDLLLAIEQGDHPQSPHFVPKPHFLDPEIEVVGGDWNHGFFHDFPFSWEWNIHPN